jgi:putative aldouronate transport system substrate-binding protein
MKRIALLLVLMMVLSSVDACTQEGGQQPAAPAPGAVTEQDAPKEIDLTLCLYFNDASDYPELKEQFPLSFEEATGYKLNMTILAREEYISKLNLLALSGELSGMIRTFGLADLIRFRNDGVIEPMESVRENATWQALPTEAREVFQVEGEVWGLPLQYVRQMFSRYYRQDWLDNVGMEVPKTIDEFYEVMKAFTFNDPNGDGSTTYGFTSSSTWTSQDIFQAFDARLDNTGSSSIAHDPMLGYFTDTMVKPERVEALEFIKKCYEEGLADPEIFTNGGAAMRERMFASQAGSMFYWSHWPSQNIDQFKAQNPNAEIVNSLGLVGKRTEKTNFVSMPAGLPYVLAKDTPNGQAMANNFLDAFIGNEEGHALARFGIEGTTFRKEGDMYVMLRDPATGTPYPFPGIVGEFPQSDIINMPYANDGTPEEIQKSLETAQANTQFVIDAMSDAQIYVVEYDIIISDAWDRLSGDIGMAFDECISSAVMGTVPVQDAIDTYVETMRAIGAADVINECNANYGLEAPEFVY